VFLSQCQPQSDADAASNMDDVFVKSAAAAALNRGGTENVRFTTSDGVVITGTLFPAGANAPTVLCLHQWRSDRASFDELARKLQAAGYTVLTIDMRGYGGSTKTVDGKPVRTDRKAQPDVTAAISFLRAHKSVDANRIAIIGASYGSSNAIQYAARDAAIKSVVLLSPGLNYFNELPTEDAVKIWGSRPMLAVASSEDVRSVETLQAYSSIASRVQVQQYDNAGHGTDILRAGVGLDALILDFLKKNL